MNLKDKVAIVTGSGSGIGKCMAEVFAKEGAKVVGASLEGAAGQAGIDDIVKQGGEATYLQCDISVEDEVEKLVAVTLEKYGRIDVLVNNAAGNVTKAFEETEATDWDWVVDTNLRGVYLCARRVVIEMLKSGGGAIVNIASVHSIAGQPGNGPYDAAKWGVVGLTKTLAVEFGTRGIRANALSPGLIDTPSVCAGLIAGGVDAETCLNSWKSNIPMGRIGKPEEIANAAVFLASDKASYITGSNILVDGGMTSQLISRPQFESAAIE
jgi:NAD(P)-dependent dehydrogenase (short-subunit alcohol dehydrogenase family)